MKWGPPPVPPLLCPPCAVPPPVPPSCSVPLLLCPAPSCAPPLVHPLRCPPSCAPLMYCAPTPVPPPPLLGAPSWAPPLVHPLLCPPSCAPSTQITRWHALTVASPPPSPLPQVASAYQPVAWSWLWATVRDACTRYQGQLLQPGGGEGGGTGRWFG